MGTRDEVLSLQNKLNLFLLHTPDANDRLVLIVVVVVVVVVDCRV